MSFISISRKTPHRLATLVEVSADDFATVDFSYTNGTVDGAESRLLSAGDVELAAASNGAPSAPSITIRLDNSDGSLTWCADQSYFMSARLRVSMVASDESSTATQLIGVFRITEPPRHGISEVELTAFFDWANLPALDLPTLADLEAAPYSDCYEQVSSGVWSQVDFSGFYNTSPFALAFWSEDMTATKRAETQVPLWFGADWHETIKHCYQRSFGVSGERFMNLLFPLFTTLDDPRADATFQETLRLRFALSVPDSPGAAIAADCDWRSASTPLNHPSTGAVSNVGVTIGTILVTKGATQFYVTYARVGFGVITRPISHLSGFLRTGDAQWKKEPGSLWAPAVFGGFFGLIAAAPFLENDYTVVRSNYTGPTQEPTTPTDERLTPLVGALQQLSFNVEKVLSQLYWATTQAHGAWRVLSIHAQHGVCSGSGIDRGHPVEVLDDLAGYYGGAFSVEPSLAAATMAATPFAAVSFSLAGEADLRGLLHQLTYPFGILTQSVAGELLFSTSRMDPSGAYLFAAPVDAEESHLLGVGLPVAGEMFAPFERLAITGDSLSTPAMLASGAESYAAAKRRLEDAALLTDLASTGVPGSGPKEIDVSLVDFPQRRAVAEQAAQLWPEGLERIEFAAAPWLIGVDVFSFLSMRIHRDGAWVDARVYLTGKRINFDNNSIVGIGYVVAATLPVAYQMINELNLMVAYAGDLIEGLQFRMDGSGNLIAQSGSNFPSVPVGSLVRLAPAVGTTITDAVATLGAAGFRNFGAYRVATTWHDVGGLQALTLEHLQDAVLPEDYATSAISYLYNSPSGVSVRFYLNAPATAPTGAVCNQDDKYDFNGSPATQMKDG